MKRIPIIALFLVMALTCTAQASLSSFVKNQDGKLAIARAARTTYSDTDTEWELQTVPHYLAQTSTANENINFTIPASTSATSGGNTVTVNWTCRYKNSSTQYPTSKTDGFACAATISSGAVGRIAISMFPTSATFSANTSGTYTGTETLTANATNATANITLPYAAAISITEQQQLKYPMQRKAGVNKNTAISAYPLSSANWVTYFQAAPYSIVQRGCFRVTGEPNFTVKVTVTMPGTSSGTGGKTLTWGATTVIGKATGGACDSTGLGYSTGVVDGTTAITLSGTGDIYVAWHMASSTTVTLSDITSNDFLSTANIISLY